jgi:hypothetical protein
MRIEILEEAERDLIEGFHFYENKKLRFISALTFSDIES